MYNRSWSSDHGVFNRTSRSFQGEDFDQPQNFRRQQSPPLNQSCYIHLPYSSPFINGKRNNGFIHPSLASNSIFYDHDYGYVNDMPNERLLSPVKNDRFGVSGQKSKASLEEPKESSRLSTRDLVQSRQNYFFSRDSRRDHKDDGNERDSHRNRIQLRSADGFASQSYRQELSSSRVLIQGGNDEKPSAPGKRRSNNDVQESRIQPASGEASEASTRSNYRCVNCLNHHMCEGNRARCAYEKQRDRFEEVKVLNLSKQQQEKEDIVKMLLKSKRVAETRKTGEKIEETYQNKLENRRSPPRVIKETEFKRIFDAQDQRNHMRRVMSASFNDVLLDQIDDKEYARRTQKQADSQFYNTSLQIKNNNYNKYLDDPETVLAVLQNQVEEKAYQKKYEKEFEVRSEQEQLQRNLELQEEEYYRKQEQDFHRKQELQASFHQTMYNKKVKQQEERARKTQDKFYVDKGYAAHKRMLQEERQYKKAQAFDLQQEIKKQQVDNSYRKRYEERKQQKTLTSFDPKPRVKNLVSCGGCYNVYEKAYMTKFS